MRNIWACFSILSCIVVVTTPVVIPDAAKMVTAAIGINYQGFVQTNLTEYPQGIRLREPAFVMKTATGYTARRAIVSKAKDTTIPDRAHAIRSENQQVIP